MTDVTPPSGIFLDDLDPAVRPQDDLYRHVNGTWEARTEIPADKSRYGSFHMLAEEAEAAVRAIIEEAQSAEPGTETRKIGDLYTSFMDEDRIRALGVAPIAADLERAMRVGSVHELVELTGELERGGMAGFYGMGVDNDPGQPDRYIVFVMQGGIGLPNESYYREDQFESVRVAYVRHIERMFALAGLDDPAENADRVFVLETAIAKHHWDAVASRDIQKMYNLRTLAELKAETPGFPWDAYLRAFDAPAGTLDQVVAAQPDALAGIAALLTDDRLAEWQAWLAWQIVRSSAAYLTPELSAANFDFYGKTLTGTPEQRERWKRGVSFTEGAMGEAIGREYVERHFAPTAKTAMDILVESIIAAYRDSITKLEWMGAETREKALDKLEKFTPKIGYPTKWRDYSGLEVDATDLVGNARRVAAFETNREFAKIGAPIDRDEWFMTPQTINAYYNPGFNEIVFPAAILQFPFFVAERDAAANYGAIGAVIGHEIGHGFDDQGSRYDGDGALADWWTEADRSAFEERTSALIAQYDALAPAQVPDAHVNGALTIGENIGDLGGLGIAWKAYLVSLDGAEPPVIDGLTGAQRFFLSWAQAWRQKGRPEETRRLLAVDPHAPNEFRCNQIVRNVDVFYDAFDVKETDAAWLAPEERVTIW